MGNLLPRGIRSIRVSRQQLQQVLRLPDGAEILWLRYDAEHDVYMGDVMSPSWPRDRHTALFGYPRVTWQRGQWVTVSLPQVLTQAWSSGICDDCGAVHLPVTGYTVVYQPDTPTPQIEFKGRFCHGCCRARDAHSGEAPPDATDHAATRALPTPRLVGH